MAWQTEFAVCGRDLRHRIEKAVRFARSVHYNTICESRAGLGTA